MQGADNYIADTNLVSRAYSVSAILHLQFLLYVMIFIVLNVLHFYVSNIRSSAQYSCFV